MTSRQKRSWWGWGNVGDALNGEEQETLTARVAALLPGTDLSVHEPPSLGSLNLPPVEVTVPAALAQLCSTDPGDRAAHAHGKAFRDVVRNLHGDLRRPPDVIVRPACEEDIVDVLEWCSDADIAVIPYGGGSSVVGGVEARFESHRGAVTLDLGRLDRVMEIDRTSRAARIQAGVLGPGLEAQLRVHGLTLRHFPQSFEFSSLGGWLATRSGGHYATLYTHIDDLVESMRAVTPSGISESRRLPASGAGPSPDRLFIGSEGSLGVISEAWMRLQDRPRWRAKASVNFDDYPSAVAACRALAQSGLYPTNCRLLDAVEAFLNAGVSVGGGLLVVAFESADHPLEAWMQRALELCRDHGGVAPEGARFADESDVPDSGQGATESWRSAFLRMPYQRDALAQRSLIVETFETACTWDRFDALHAAVIEAANDAIRRISGAGVVTCRFSHVYPDGPAPYFSVYAAGRWGSTVAQWDEIKAAVSDALVAHGGTITHHHAIGRDHRPWYDTQRPDPFASALIAAKRALDPAGILNPGVLLAESVVGWD